MSLGIDHKILACLEVSKPRVLDVPLLLIIILEATLALVQVPELLLGLLTKVEARVLEILFMDRLKFNYREISCGVICARSFQIHTSKLCIMCCQVFRRKITAFVGRTSSVISGIKYILHQSLLIFREHGRSHRRVWQDTYKTLSNRLNVIHKAHLPILF